MGEYLITKYFDIVETGINEGFAASFQMMLPYLLIIFLFIILISFPLAILSKKLDKLEEERKQKIWDQRHRRRDQIYFEEREKYEERKRQKRQEQKQKRSWFPAVHSL